MTDYTGIARLLSDRPTDAVSLDWLKKAHDAQLTLCEALEEIADSLPANINRQKCIYAAKSLVPLVNGIHRYEEEALFPLLERLRFLCIVDSNLAFLVLIVVGILDTWLLYRFFTVQLPTAKRAEAVAKVPRAPTPESS